MAIDLKALSKEQLANLLENAERRDRMDIAADVLNEMSLRGFARKSDFRFLRWNQDSVKLALAPFVEIAKRVKLNQRTTYTEAGGLKIGRNKESPDWKWVDTYTAIKTNNLNAAFICYISRPGDEPEFHLRVGQEPELLFNHDNLLEALKAWKSIAERA
jgi:hypothetical protein